MESFKIMERKWIWFSISLAVIAAGVVSLAFHGLNWGIDFTGGNILHYDVKQSYNLQEVRDVLGSFDTPSEAKKAGNASEQLVVRTGTLTKQQQLDISDALSKIWPQLELIQSESIAPVIGRELQKQAITALLIATLGMLAYITFRFEFKSALAAVVALMHDIAIVLSFYALFYVPIDGTFIAVILTIVGYSINDTIVIFDRIRENLKTTLRKTFNELANASVYQSLSRTVNTSLTTLLTISMLFLIGGPTLKDFTLALIVGIVSGTYSSIFIASPLWGMFRTEVRA